MGCWFVRPEVVRLDLPEGQWLDVKKYLTRGEFSEVIAAMAGEVSPAGWRRPNVEMSGLAMVMAYLVDWSLDDANGKRVQIDTTAKKKSALNNLALEHYHAIENAVSAHIDSMAVVLEEKKRTAATETASALSS